MPQILWTQYFIKAQGFTVNKSVLFQDSLSAMILDWIGMESRSKQTKQIRVRYYLIKDYISTGDIVAKHCPTREMSADHFTKPLQWEIFQKSRSEIQGIPTTMKHKEMCWDALGTFNMVTDETNTSTSNPRPQGCVGKYRNYDLSTRSSRIMGDKKGLESKSCRVTSDSDACNRLEAQYFTKKYVCNICECPHISYSEAVNRGLAINTLRPKEL